MGEHTEEYSTAEDREDRKTRIVTVEDVMTASQEELLEAACRYYDTLSGTDNLVAGIRLGFKIADPDEGWKQVASAWLADLRRDSLDNLRKKVADLVRKPGEVS